MDEFVDISDISTISFQSPLPRPTSELGQLGTLGDTALIDAPFMNNPTHQDREDDEDEQKDGCKDANPTLGVDSPATPTVIPHFNNKDMNKNQDNQIAETTSSRQRRIRVNIEIERIIVSIKCILSNTGSQFFE